jgi:hypothetical protein
MEEKVELVEISFGRYDEGWYTKYFCHIVGKSLELTFCFATKYLLDFFTETLEYT